MADSALAQKAFFDLHCHTSYSFDSLARPRDQVRAAAARGLTHLAITDHDRIDGALEARDQAPDGLTVIIGEEVKTADGDLICVFLERALPPGRSALETIAAAREQGALVGVPHPFDRYRNSLLREARLASLVSLVDWVETWNARVVGRNGNEQAALFALEHGLPGVAVSDAHSTLEVGVAYNTALFNPAAGPGPSTADGLRAALGSHEIVTGRASYFVRGLTPIAKGVNRARGNVRVHPAGAP
jgi:predicted metal-dependent phosphoesterase TrpH